MKTGARVYHSGTRVSLRYLSWPWVAGLLALLSLVLHGPLLPQFSSAVPSDLGDPLLNTWILWWNAQRLPLTEAYWNAPAFAPASNAFALSETLLGLTWLTTPLQWLGASPLVAYNVMFVLEPVLNGLSAYWLCITLSGRRDAALVGALAFAFAPYHASQLSHLQTEATFFMPVALVGLHRYWTSGAWRWLVLFSAAMIPQRFGLRLLPSLFQRAAWPGDRLDDDPFARLSQARRRSRRVRGRDDGVVTCDPAVSRSAARMEPASNDRRDRALQRRLELDGSRIAAPFAVARPHARHRPELAGYPGLAIGVLLIAAAMIAIRDHRAEVSNPRWRHLLVRVLSFLSLSFLIVGIVAFLMGGVTYKVFGIALDLGLLAALLSARFRSLVRSGSISGLYATGAIVASILALGPVGRVLGHRFGTSRRSRG